MGNKHYSELRRMIYWDDRNNGSGRLSTIWRIFKFEFKRIVLNQSYDKQVWLSATKTLKRLNLLDQLNLK